MHIDLHATATKGKMGILKFNDVMLCRCTWNKCEKEHFTVNCNYHVCNFQSNTFFWEVWFLGFSSECHATKFSCRGFLLFFCVYTSGMFHKCLTAIKLNEKWLITSPIETFYVENRQKKADESLCRGNFAMCLV